MNLLTNTKETSPGPRDSALHEFGRRPVGWPRRRGTSSKRTWAGRGRLLRVWPGVNLELHGRGLRRCVCLARAATRAGLLGLGQIVLDAVMGEMVERRSSLRGVPSWAALRASRVSGSVMGAAMLRSRAPCRGGRTDDLDPDRRGSVRDGDRRHRGRRQRAQRLGQFGVFLLQLAVVGRGRGRARACNSSTRR